LSIDVEYPEFREAWLADILEGNPSTTQKGHTFAQKMLKQWRDIDESSNDLLYCDGAGDGGIDIAYLLRSEQNEGKTKADADGATWYLVQSKFGSAFQGANTLIEEGRKVISTLAGERKTLSSLAEGLVEKLTNFRKSAGEQDRIVLVFATVDPLGDDEKKTLGYVRSMGQGELGLIFDVVTVSVETLYEQMHDDMTTNHIGLPLRAEFAPSGQGLLVGSVPLFSLYAFLKDYRTKTQDLDRLYEKNVRRYLSNKGRINKGIEETLRETPELFGLYNNGITVVVTDFQPQEGGTVQLTDPYVVNGCQTTRTIWEVFQRKLDHGGQGKDADLESWKERVAQGVVVTKVAKVGQQGEDKLKAITRFTNSQNAVREKDFLALGSDDFKTWAGEMAQQYGVFLETQRGGWDSQRALQNQKPASTQHFSEHANAFDLLKVYGAGWLGEAGTAFGSNAAFLPNGAIYKRIFDADSNAATFGVDDLYAAYRLQQAADGFKFGRAAEKDSRRQTRFLFYMIAVDILKNVIQQAGLSSTRSAISKAMLNLWTPVNKDAIEAWLNAAINAVDSYFTSGSEMSVQSEPQLIKNFNTDINGYLKWDQLGKSSEASPHLTTLLLVTKVAIGHKIGSQQSPRDMITAAMTA